MTFSVFDSHVEQNFRGIKIKSEKVEIVKALQNRQMLAVDYLPTEPDFLALRHGM